jgi:hypothetical protein
MIGFGYVNKFEFKIMRLLRMNCELRVFLRGGEMIRVYPVYAYTTYM